RRLPVTLLDRPAHGDATQKRGIERKEPLQERRGLTIINVDLWPTVRTSAGEDIDLAGALTVGDRHEHAALKGRIEGVEARRLPPGEGTEALGVRPAARAGTGDDLAVDACQDRTGGEKDAAVEVGGVSIPAVQGREVGGVEHPHLRTASRTGGRDQV